MKKLFTLLSLIAFFATASKAQTVIINTGTAGTPSYNAGPIYRSSAASGYDASRYCYLYTAAELSAAGITSGSVINLVGWAKNNTATTTGGATFRVFMKNSVATSFSNATETWANLNTGATMVYENLSQTIPALTSPDYIEFPLSTSFVYTGGSLEISTEWDISLVSGNPTTGTFEWLWSTVVDRIYGTGQTVLANAGTLSSTTNSISTIDDRRPFIKIGYSGGTTGIDIGAQSLVTPAIAANNCYTGAEIVTVRIRNYSTNPINFATNPVTITTNVTGAATQVLTASVTSGTLAAASTLDVTMTGTLNMSATGTYTFNATAVAVGDVNAGNNGMPSTNITKAVLSAGTVSASPPSYCITPGAPTLSTTGADGYGSLQWQQSTTLGAGFTNIPGASTNPYTLAGPIGQTMYYRLIASCSGSNMTSNEVSVVLSNPQITGTTPGSACGPGPVPVTLAATGTGNTTFNWYTAASGGTPIGTGSPFVTPPISTNTTYYVSASTGGVSANTGLPAQIAGTSGAGTTNFGIVFDALSAFTLNSVVVYPVSATAGVNGTVTIDVIDGTGAVVHTATVNVVGNPVASATAQTVPLNFNITPGTNYKLRPGSRGAGITGLLFEPSATAPGGNYGYPFTVPGVLSLNHSTLSAAPGNTPRLDLYYYFYNWDISSGCESGRTAVLASITGAPSATISYAGSPYCTNGGTANVTRTGTAGGTYSSAAGLNINAATGAVALGSSTPGTYTITYTIPATSSCPLFTTTTSITINAASSATITYAGSPYCTSSGTATVTQTGTTGGTYSATPVGLSLNTSTGAVTLVSSTEGTYTVTYTVAATASCAAFSTTASITIRAASTATIAYTGSPYCNSGTANVTRTGTTGGTYSATPAGLTINAATGAVTLGTSTPGSYMVTYNIAATGGCPASMTMAGIIVNTCGAFPCLENFDAVTVPVLPAGWIASTEVGSCAASTPWTTVNTVSNSAPNSAFTNDPNCVSDESLETRTYAIPASGTSQFHFMLNYDLEATATPVAFDGMVMEISVNLSPFDDIITAGGTFVTGGYNKTISTSFGNPLAGRDAWSGNSGGWVPSTVNLPATAIGQDVVFRFRRGTDISVSRTGAGVDDVYVSSTAAISYAGSPYCSNGGTATVTQTGATGGTYSAAPPGLSINASTGAVNLNASTAGTYTVTYASNNNCPAVSATTSITVQAAPSATINYAGSPYCQNAGTASVTQTGTSGGTYSSTTGLSLNATTGAVTLGSSTPGTYTVTYTINPGGACANFSTTAQIMIAASPTVDQPGNQTVCAGAITAAVNFTGSAGATYNWTNNNTGIGLAASGTGNIAAFTATNATTSPISATITVTPTFTNGGVTCTGAAKTFTITVNPQPTVNQPASQVVCNNAATLPVNFTGSAGSVFNWTNSNTTIGLAATGTGNIASFTAVNAGNAPVIATVTVTPNLASGGGPVTTTYTSTTNVEIPTVPNTSGIANPYPTTINVAGAAGTITKVVVKLNGLNHTFPDDIDMMLVSPGGQDAIIMSDCGLTGDLINVNLVLDDAAADNLPDGGQIVSGTFKPTNYGANDPFDPPAPATSANVALSTFNGATANGIWSLYIDDDVGGDFGSMANGWELVITTTGGSVACPGVPKTFTYTVNPTPVVNAVPNRTECNNTTTAPIVFTTPTTGGTVTYSWTNSNPAIGLAASGTGNIPAYLATNAGTAPIMATISVTPSYSNAGVTCVGAASTFTITVNPTPNVNQPANQTVCVGLMTAPVAFAGTVPGTTFEWVNNNTATGLAASGTGNIAAFTTTNTTAVPIVSTITVTPYFGPSGGGLQPDLLHYKFDGSGTTVPNLALTPPAGTATATINGAQTQGSPGICSGSLRGTGGSSTNDFVNTGWATNLTGTSWTLSLKLSNIPSGDFSYLFGDNTAGSFRCFTNGAAGTGNLMLRGPINDVIITGGAQTAAHTSTFVYDAAAGNIKGYLDGTLVTTVTQAPVAISGTGPFKVGGYATSGSLTAGGQLDEFRLYNRALSAVDVQSLSTCAASGNACAGPAKIFTITVNPVLSITCPSNITLTSAVGSCNAVATYSPVVTGAPAPAITYSFTGATTGTGTGNGSGSAFNVGVTTVTLTATNVCGTKTCTFTVTVLDGQLPVITAQPTTRNACENSSTTLSVTATNAVSYQWEFFNGTAWVAVAGATSRTLTVNNLVPNANTNTYRVKVIGLCTTITSGNATIFVWNKPQVSIVSTQTLLIPGSNFVLTAVTNTSGGSFVWFKNGVVIPGVTGSTLPSGNIDDRATYKVTYTDANGCVNTSADYVIGSQPTTDIFVYPNPSNGQFQIRYNNLSNEEATIYIYNAKGQVIYQRKMPTGTQTYARLDVNISNMAAGRYVIKLINGAGRVLGSKQIIKAN